jgi:hypothetical protein
VHYAKVEFVFLIVYYVVIFNEISYIKNLELQTINESPGSIWWKRGKLILVFCSNIYDAETHT